MKKRKAAGITAGCLVLVLCAGAGGYKMAADTYEGKITELQKEADDLREQVKKSGKYEWSDTEYNYLALGNSITRHGLCDYWWSESGMAATSEDKDYVHRVAAMLEKEKGNVCTFAYNYSVWELQSKDRAETFELIDRYLDERLDLVTVQLSENVSDLSTYESDYEELIRHIQQNAPSARIIVIDDFWYGEEKSVLKETAADNTGVSFVSLAQIRGNAEYQCGLGTAVYDAEGEAHIVEHEGVAEHPGDKGMEYIAEEVVRAAEQ